MKMITVSLPEPVVAALYKQAKRELDYYTRVGITPEQIFGNDRTFYIHGQYLPAIVDACAPPPPPDPTRFVPPCTCRIACSVGDVNYISGEADCPVHGYGDEEAEEPSE